MVLLGTRTSIMRRLLEFAACHHLIHLSIACHYMAHFSGMESKCEKLLGQSVTCWKATIFSQISSRQDYKAGQSLENRKRKMCCPLMNDTKIRQGMSFTARFLSFRMWHLLV